MCNKRKCLSSIFKTKQEKKMLIFKQINSIKIKFLFKFQLLLNLNRKKNNSNKINIHR